MPDLTPPDDSHEPIDKGMAAAFGQPKATSPSVLRILQARTDSKLGVHLRDSEGPAGPPVRIGEETKAIRDPEGRYHVLGEIARGGMGVVYKGRDVDLGRDVAMKVLHDKFEGNADVLERFVEEAQIGGQLQHPGIVPVYELGLQHDKRPYFAMKLVKGETLAARLAKRADVSEDRRRYFAIFEQICQTMAYAHVRHVVHRDLKPANVMIGAFGEVQVVDWGFAKVLGNGGVVDEAKAKRKAESERSIIETVRSSSGSGTHSVMGSMLGTPAYMPPEQATGDVDRMDERSDVFGLGGILCEILTGEPPYVEADGDLVQQAARGDTGKAMARIDACGANKVMIALCKQCLAPARRARPQTAKEVADQVGGYLSSVEERAHQAEIRAAQAKIKARSTVLLSLAAVVVLAMGGGGYLWMQSESAKRQADAEHLLTDAMQDVSTRLGEARASGLDLESWAKVGNATHEVERLVGSEYVGDPLRGRVQKLLATAEREHDEAKTTVARHKRDEDMRETLLAVRIPADDNLSDEKFEKKNAQRMHFAFSKAFQNYLGGRKIQDLSIADAADALAKSPIAIELAAALDLWGVERRRAEKIGELTKKLERLARRLDSDDAWRNDLRDLIPHGADKRKELEELAEKADFDKLPKLSIALLGEALWFVGAQDAAIDVLRRGRLVHPQDFALCLRLGLMRESSGRWATEVVDEYSTAAALRPEMNEVWHRLGATMGCAGRHREAEELFRRLAARDPDSDHWYSHIGGSLRSQGKSAEAVALFREMASRRSNSAMMHNSLGAALFGQGEWKEALECFDRALAIEPSANAHANRGNALMQLSKLAEAVESYRKALQDSPQHFNARNNVRALLVRLGKRDEAIVSHQEWLKLEPHQPFIYMELGQMLQAEGKPKQALDYFLRGREMLSKREAGVDQQWKQGWMRNFSMQISVLNRVRKQQPRLLAIARGEEPSNSARTLLNAAKAAQHEKEYVAAARTYQRAFARSSGSIKKTYTYQFDALCCAVLAAGGHGKDAKGLSAEQRTELLDDGYEYLVWQIGLEKERIKDRSKRVPDGAARMAWWLQDKDLVGVREEKQLSSLPKEEAERWRKFWKDVGATLPIAKKLGGAIERLELAEKTYDQGDYIGAAKIYTETLVKHPEMSLVRWYRYNLACSLALAANGKGKGGDKLGEERRTEMRTEALAWLLPELARVKQQIERDEDVTKMIERLRHWQNDGDFTGVRGEALKALPEEQAEPWREFWKNVRATQKRAEGK